MSRALPKHTGWSPAFRRMLERAAADAELQQGVDQMMLAIASRGASNWLGR